MDAALAETVYREAEALLTSWLDRPNLMTLGMTPRSALAIGLPPPAVAFAFVWDERSGEIKLRLSEETEPAASFDGGRFPAGPEDIPYLAFHAQVVTRLIAGRLASM